MTSPPPVIGPAGLTTVAPGVRIIPDRRVPLVPNVGTVEGDRAVLVVDCGMGPANGAAVLGAARRVAGGRPLILTTTPFHPEHAFGPQAFKGQAQILANTAQEAERQAKGAACLGMFRGFSPDVAAALEGTALVAPDRIWDGAVHRPDLGGRTAEPQARGPAHGLGDRTVWVPDAGVQFAGDLAEEGIFPVFPWFPPDDADIDTAGWLAARDAMADLAPAVVVPGHGSPGGAGLLRAVAACIRRVAAAVRAGRAAGEPVDALAERPRAEMTAAHPDRKAPERIGFAVRHFADRSP